jgi:hypothetical protein
MDKQLLILMGGQAGGKTTVRNLLIEKVEHKIAVINSDLVWPVDDNGDRYWLDGDGQPRSYTEEPFGFENYQFSLDWAFKCFIHTMDVELRDRIIYEEVFETPRLRQRVTNAARKRDYSITGVWFRLGVEEALARNEIRFNPVPSSVIEETYKHFITPKQTEGFDNLITIHPHGDLEETVNGLQRLWG